MRCYQFTIRVENITKSELIRLFSSLYIRVDNIRLSEPDLRARWFFYPDQDYPRVHILGNLNEEDKAWMIQAHIDVLPHGRTGNLEYDEKLRQHYPDPEGLTKKEIMLPLAKLLLDKFEEEGFNATGTVRRRGR